jgi:hypothetical protein
MTYVTDRERENNNDFDSMVTKHIPKLEAVKKLTLSNK